MLVAWRLEHMNRLTQGPKTLEELAEIRGAMKMLRAVEGLPAHVHDTLEEVRVQEERKKENTNARR